MSNHKGYEFNNGDSVYDQEEYNYNTDITVVSVKRKPRNKLYLKLSDGSTIRLNDTKFEKHSIIPDDLIGKNICKILEEMSFKFYKKLSLMQKEFKIRCYE